MLEIGSRIPAKRTLHVRCSRCKMPCMKQHEETLNELFIQFHRQSSKNVLKEESRNGMEFVAQNCLCKAT